MIQLLKTWFKGLFGGAKASAQGLYGEPTASQVERLIAAAKGEEYRPPEKASLYSRPTYSQFERLIAALGGGSGSGSGSSLFFAQYYPGGEVKSAAEFTAGIKYDLDGSARTATARPFCSVDGTAENDNSGLVGRVVIPPFVDAQGNPYISDDGTRYKVVGVSNGNFGGSNANLTAIVAPNTVTNIGDNAFLGCSSLVSVLLPAATRIRSFAFGNCSGLTNVTIGNSVTSIGNYAFYNCRRLASVAIPDSVTSIGNHAFEGCSGLASVAIPDSVTSIGYEAFRECRGLTSITIGDGVTSIANYAFNGCSGLTNVTIGNSVTSIGDSAFIGCFSLDSVDFGDTPRQSVPSFGVNAFNNVPTSCKIIVPDAQYNAWTSASGWSNLVTQGYKFLRHSEWEYARKYEVSQEIQDAIEYAVVVDDKLVPVEGPSSEEILYNGSSVATYLAEHLPSWTCNSADQSAVLRNRYGRSPEYYHYDLSLFTDRIVFWVEGQELGAHGSFTRNVLFPKSGVYSLDIEYAAGYNNYPDAVGQARFVVDAGTSGEQDVTGINDSSIVQTAHLQFVANAGNGSIVIKGKTGLPWPSCCVVIASVKVTLVKEIGIEIGDIVAPDVQAQTGQAADAKATHDQMAGLQERIAALESQLAK